ncbi:hypothetical protein BFN03_06325 [Rhodococcus sp. WMMA185]|nr:hypothetical protein BFN03_06325 [Rhodococcus sp. WMMA185]
MMPPIGPQVPSKEKNTLGLIGLIVGIVGLILVCIPVVLILGWVLLPIAFILGIVGVAQSGKAKGTSIAAIVVSIVGALAGMIAAFVFFASAVDEALDDALNELELSAPAPAVSGDNEGKSGSEAGSRQNPLPIGETVANEDWEITLGTPREAWAEIAAENQFNDPPEAGMEFWMVPLTATYTGEDTTLPWLDITAEFVGTDNRTYGDECGVLPNDLFDIDELYPGGTIEANVCAAVPAGADGLWSVSTGLLGEPVFFAAP